MSLARVTAFLRKDLVEVLRQPRLIFTLIIGPFLILFLFGIGFDPRPPELRTVIAASPDIDLEIQRDLLAESLGEQASIVGVVESRTQATALIDEGSADVAVILPKDILAAVERGERSRVEVIHDVIDPFERSVVEFFAARAVDQLNQEVLQELIDRGTAEFEAVDSEVVVQPFDADTSNYRGVAIEDVLFYVPGVIALLVQHLTLTFAALSVVRERSQGIDELFRVSPLAAGEMLAGKYLANIITGFLVAGALSAGAYYAFGLRPIAGWGWYVLSILLVILISQGLGFILSSLAKTESQAVQYAMITLLLSIFFSGLFISLDRLTDAIRPISYLVPASYGIQGLQAVAFFGSPPDLTLVGTALAYAILAGLIALLLMRRATGHRRRPKGGVASGKTQPVSA